MDFWVTAESRCGSWNGWMYGRPSPSSGYSQALGFWGFFCRHNWSIICKKKKKKPTLTCKHFVCVCISPQNLEEIVSAAMTMAPSADGRAGKGQV